MPRLLPSSRTLDQRDRTPKTGAMTFSMRLAHSYPCRQEERFTVKVHGKIVDEFGTDGKEF